MSRKRDEGGQTQDQIDGEKRRTGASADSQGADKAGMGKDGAMRDQTNDKGERKGGEKGSRASSK